MPVESGNGGGGSAQVGATAQGAVVNAGYVILIYNGTAYVVPDTVVVTTKGGKSKSAGDLVDGTVLGAQPVGGNTAVAPAAIQSEYGTTANPTIPGVGAEAGPAPASAPPALPPSTHDANIQPRPVSAGTSTPAPASTPASTGGGPTGSGGGSAGGGTTPAGSATTTPDDTSEPQSDWRGVPPDGDLYLVDGITYWGRDVTDPHTGEKVGFVGFVVPVDQLDLLAGDLAVEYTFTGTAAEAAAIGFVNAGDLHDVTGDENDDPLESFLDDWGEAMSLSPMYDDPEILMLAVEAALEGREITANELQQTDWFQSRNDRQQEWDLLVATQPAQAATIQRSNRERIRDEFARLGYADVSNELVSLVADTWTNGTLTETEAFRHVLRETDPYATGASRYAGVTRETLDELGWQVIKAGDNLFIRTPEGDFKIEDRGGIARFSAMATTVETPYAGKHVVINGKHYLERNGEYYLATGQGQIDGLNRLYGAPTQATVGKGDPPVAGTVVDLFGGPGGIEKYGELSEAGVAESLAFTGEDGGDLDTVGLGEEERVRQLLLQYVGPYHAANYSDAWVAEWAGKLRNGGPGEIDRLTQDLQRDFRGLFPGYDGNDLSYEGIAGPSRGLWSRYSGNQVDENDAGWLEFLQQGPAAENREGWLRRRGLSAGWAPVQQEALASLTSAFGDQVRRSLV